MAVAQSEFSHNDIQNKNTKELQEMLFKQHNINWGEDFSPSQKRGSNFQRVTSYRQFTTDEIDKLPLEHEARKNPNLKVRRTDVKQVVLPKLASIRNPIEVVFEGAEPLLKTTSNPTELEEDIDNTKTIYF